MFEFFAGIGVGLIVGWVFLPEPAFCAMANVSSLFEARHLSHNARRPRPVCPHEGEASDTTGST